MLHKVVHCGVADSGTCLLQAPMRIRIRCWPPRRAQRAGTMARAVRFSPAANAAAVDLAARGYPRVKLPYPPHHCVPSPGHPHAGSRPRVRSFSGRDRRLLDASAQFESAPLWASPGNTSCGAVMRDWRDYLRGGRTRSEIQRRRVRVIDACPGRGGWRACRAKACLATSLAQVGALFRSSSKENPLLGLNPQRVIAAGYAGGSDQSRASPTTVHRMLKSAMGSPVFDAS